MLFSGGGSGPNATGAAATIAAAASSESESLESLRDGRFSSSLPYASSPKNASGVDALDVLEILSAVKSRARENRGPSSGSTAVFASNEP